MDKAELAGDRLSADNCKQIDILFNQFLPRSKKDKKNFKFEESFVDRGLGLSYNTKCCECRWAFSPQEIIKVKAHRNREAG